ncbi:hypothetical protein F5Y16DRAFT_395750 [Xylariaceae sp. FL0255]|nr:hypothetical protein F5Y16DRAFT_395750 [Xylariaceae sp. FL0255]
MASSSSEMEQASHVENVPEEHGGGGDRSELDSRMEDANADEAIKDQVDGAVATGPRRADASTGGRVNVAETGDLNELAARRRSASQSKGL